MTRTWTMFDVVDAVNCAVYGERVADEQLLALTIGGAKIDARDVVSGDLFIALQGRHGHGLQFAGDAFARGAVGVLVGNDDVEDDDRFEQWLGAAAEHGPVALAVDCDGVTALGRAARARRRRAAFQVVAITGSTGKTTTKDLLRAMLATMGVAVHASHENYNNEIGVPLTLLQAPHHSDVVICEMGMRGSGQIAYLCDIADPDVGIVTNAGSAHLELLGSRDAIVAAKAEIISGTWTGGTAVFPADQPELAYAADRVPDRALPFGTVEDDEAVVAIVEVARTAGGISGTLDIMGDERAFDLPLHGVHNARNLAAAVCAIIALRGTAHGIDDSVLTVAHTTRGRGDRHDLGDGCVVIDDSYNANPESMRAALNELAAITTATRRIAVLGPMAELGPDAPQLHRAIGEHAAVLPIDQLVLVGEGVDIDAMRDGWRSVRDEPVERIDSVDAALQSARAWTRPGTAMLIKASNGAQLGRLVRHLVEPESTMTAHAKADQ